MTSMQKGKSNWLLSIIICLILVATVVLSVVAVVLSSGTESEGPESTPTIPREEDTFDPNNVLVREDPIVMTMDLLPVKYSEFCYFYYISAGELLEAAEDPVALVENGVDGVSFQTKLFQMAKEYAAKYVLYRHAYETAGYVVNETYKAFLQSNFMMAEDGEELAEMNEELLSQFGIVRNEYIDILVYNNAIDSYKQTLGDEAEYTDAELEEIYDEQNSLFREKTICFIELNMADEALANNLVEQIKNGQDMKGLVSEYSVSSTKYSDGGMRTGNVEDFNGEQIRAFLTTAKKDDVAVVKEKNAIYVIRCENDGSFAQKKEVVKKYKAMYDFDMTLSEKIENGEITITKPTLLEELELPAFVYEMISKEEL